MTTLNLQNTLREIVIDSSNAVEKIDCLDSSVNEAKQQCSYAEEYANEAETAAQEASSYAQEAWSHVDSIEDEISDLRQQVEDLQTLVCKIGDDTEIRSFEAAMDENEKLRASLRNLVGYAIAQLQIMGADTAREEALKLVDEFTPNPPAKNESEGEANEANKAS